MVFIISIIASIAWIQVLKKFDHSRRYKTNASAVHGFFIYGLLSMPLVLVLYYYFIPIVAPIASRSETANDLLLVGPVEELGKFLVFYLAAVGSSSIKEPRDGILHAASVGLAFAVLENIFYSFAYGVPVLLLRSVLTTAGHMSYAAIWGYATGVYLYTRNAHSREYGISLVASALVLAAFFHGLYNAFLDANMPAAALLLDAANLSIALWSLSYLKKLSPFERIPFSQYRQAIPQLETALASNEDNFFLHKRLALHYLRAGKLEKARLHFKRASRINPRELSSKLYHALIDTISPFKDQSEHARVRLYRIAGKMSPSHMRQIVKEIRQLFQNHPSSGEVQAICDDLMEWKSGNKSRAAGRPAGSPRREMRARAGLSGAYLTPEPELLKDFDPEAVARKERAFGRIIEKKREELG